MRVAFQNLLDSPQSVDVDTGTRVYLTARGTEVVDDCDPWWLNQDPILRATVARGDLAVTFIADLDDLVALGVNVATNGTPLGAVRVLDFIGTPVVVTGDTATVTLGGGGGGSALILFQAERVGSTTTPRFLGAPAVELALVEPRIYQAPVAGTLSRLRVSQSAPNGNGNVVVYTVRINGVASALSVSMASTDLVGANVLSAVPVSAGDQIDLRVTKALAIGASPRGVLAAVELN